MKDLYRGFIQYEKGYQHTTNLEIHENNIVDSNNNILISRKNDSIYSIYKTVMKLGTEKCIKLSH
jgi:hypothetical protein